ncbi:hypothetical protein BSKO_01985 [Bryopsis sp. KO-2023]|nr:hypothetical protein BSKO_01985 [Bryopsis sp. KO-2023]
MGEGGEIRRVFWSDAGTVWGLTDENHICECRVATGKVSSKPVRVVAPAVKLDFEVDGATFRSDGKFAVLFGYKGNVPGVAVVDLVAYRAPSRGVDDVRECECRVLTRDQVVGCPGVRIQRLRFLPSNGCQFGILGSNNRWTVYDVSNLEKPVRTFKLDFLRCGGWGKNAGVAVDFDFGPQVAWGAVSVFFLRRDGKVYLACPIPLPKMKLPLLELQEMEENGRDVDRHWCGHAFASRWKDPAVSQDLPDWWKEEPMLQGPLNPDPLPFDRCQDPPVEMTVTTTGDAVRVFTVTEHGSVTEYFLDGAIQPRWSNPGAVPGLHNPMLAPNLVFRQGQSRSTLLLTISQAVVGRKRSRLRGFSVCPMDGGSNALVVRDDGVFSVGFPPFTQDYEDQSSDFDSQHSRNVIREDPIVECLHRGCPRNGWTVLGGFFMDGRIVIVGGEGRSLVMAQPQDVGTDCESPSPTMSSPGSHLEDPLQRLHTVDSMDSFVQSIETDFLALEESMTSLEVQLGPPGPSEDTFEGQVKDLNAWVRHHEGTTSVVQRYSKDVASTGKSLQAKLKGCHSFDPSKPELEDVERRLSNVTERQSAIWKDLKGAMTLQKPLLEQGSGS